MDSPAREFRNRAPNIYAAERAAKLAEERERVRSLVPEHQGNCYACGVVATRHADLGCRRFVRSMHG